MLWRISSFVFTYKLYTAKDSRAKKSEHDADSAHNALIVVLRAVTIKKTIFLDEAPCVKFVDVSEN
jgi:hypothetical protein